MYLLLGILFIKKRKMLMSLFLKKIYQKKEVSISAGKFNAEEISINFTDSESISNGE